MLGTDGDRARIRRDDAAAGEAAEVLLPIEDMAEAKPRAHRRADRGIAQARQAGREANSADALNDNQRRESAQRQFQRRIRQRTGTRAQHEGD